jgi:uncharacterized SAM-binding protein YcdF (DUF218 family)
MQVMEKVPSVFRRSWGYRLVRSCVLLVIFCATLYLFRFTILRGLGEYLISEDPPAHADVAYVLGGASIDRGEEAAKLYRSGSCSHFVCTGANVPGDLEEMGITLTESEMTKRVLVRCGVPAEQVIALREGTSTQEESLALLAYTKQGAVDTVIVVSHGFHLRRVRNVFVSRFKAAGITVLLHAAESPDFSRDTWWKKEQGMMMVQNEYAKLLYYAVKH